MLLRSLRIMIAGLWYVLPCSIDIRVMLMCMLDIECLGQGQWSQRRRYPVLERY